MEIFNVGVLELALILLLAFILLGPQGMIQTARDLGRLMRKILHSPLWASLREVEREVRQVPTRLIREAGLDELEAELRRSGQEILPPQAPPAPTRPPSPPQSPSADPPPDNGSAPH
ncbi:hypothetical protein [uncultured Thermanaerothrix sp.]|uniref:hypothetical protein n=1 Tax=uncultured Thermanaerothrix sp. TaxID=1195149 RepID=UPI0026207B2F|nr:hypothetical protein [uncultured Thermanaerothrix sp.]